MNQTSHYRELQFETDGFLLSGILHLPDPSPFAVVIGCHGLLADKNSPKQIELAHQCTAMGMAYLRFDHRGCGESEGCFATDTTLENRSADLLAAVHTIFQIFGSQIPIGLFGSSLGGTVCLSVLDKLSPFALVTLATPIQSESIRMPEGTPESLTEELMKNRLRFDISGNMGSVHHILILHGTNDETVPVQNAHAIYAIAAQPKKIVLLNGSDHRISDTANQQRFVRESLDWYTNCLEQKRLL